MSKMHIKTGDMVVVISGADSNGKEPHVGKVLGVSPKEGKCIVEGAHVVSKHVKARRQGETGGIVERETPIRACKVMRVCPKCNKPTRAAFGTDKDGNKVRICKKCGAEI